VGIPWKSKKIATVFALALAARILVFLAAVEDPRVFFQPDSYQYVLLAEGLMEHHTFCHPDTPFRPDAERMPGYPFFLASIMKITGGNHALLIVLQIVIDSLACVLILFMGEGLYRGIGLLSGLLAAVNMGMITYCQFVLTDSLFLFVFLVGITLALSLLKKADYRLFMALGFTLGIGCLIRPAIVYFVFFLCILLLVHCLVNLKTPPIRAIAGSLAVLLFFMGVLIPWMARNQFHYGQFRLHAQTGEHLLKYVVPFVWQYSKGIPFLEGKRKAGAIVSERMTRRGLLPQQMTPFEKSHLKVEIAVDILKNESLKAVLKSWMFGIVKNLGAPALVDFSYLLRIQRPHFFSSAGSTLMERAENFILKSGSFGMLMVVHMLITALFRLFQLIGLVRLFKDGKMMVAILFISVIGYFLFISGPVGYAKYRLPFEPILIVLSAIGIKSVYEYSCRRKKLMV